MLKDLLTRARSYRSFDESVPVSRERLLSWIDLTRLCPSSINLQMLKLRPVTEKAECDGLLAATRWAGKLKDVTLPPKGHAPTAYVVICADTEVIASAEQFQKDVGILAQTLLLSAVEDGFGGCMIGSFSKETVMALLDLPEHLPPQLVIALGKPDERVETVPLPENGDPSYYRENGVHYVPKRSLDELIIP
ncbi:MAG: nitroreductase family protein [Clostridia bacterium]|nr:nitroreductase family protein [Clostridia bacterium]